MCHETVVTVKTCSENNQLLCVALNDSGIQPNLRIEVDSKESCLLVTSQQLLR